MIFAILQKLVSSWVIPILSLFFFSLLRSKYFEVPLKDENDLYALISMSRTIFHSKYDLPALEVEVFRTRPGLTASPGRGSQSPWE